MSDVVGRVLGTEDATPLRFWAAVEPDSQLQLDDIVVTDRVLPSGDTISMYGVVSQMRARHEGARFDSDVFLIVEGILPAEVSEAARIRVTRVVPETLVPPLPGAEVRRANEQERAKALAFDTVEIGRLLPAGLSRAGDPVYLDLDFVDGTLGAHINISGISGVATKTSYATFLLYSLFNSGVLGPDGTAAKGLIFNVKGEELLFLDHNNVDLDDEQRGRYSVLGLDAAPFRSVGISVPPPRGDAEATTATVARRTGASPYGWTIADFCSKELLPFLFLDAEDANQQYPVVVQAVKAQLAKCADESTDTDGSVRLEDTTVRRFSELVGMIERKLKPDNGEPGDPLWTRHTATVTLNAFLRRLHAAVPHVEHLICADAPGDAIELDSSEVTVVDIHQLHDRAKYFVVGAVLRTTLMARELSGVAEPLLFVMLDELNKFAPRDSNSPIKDILMDVAQWGRSLGIVLIGVQQTASEVEHRLVANSAVRVVGRLDSAEAEREQYGFLSGVQRQQATILMPGSVYLFQPRVPTPLFVEFPIPAWATDSAEAE